MVKLTPVDPTKATSRAQKLGLMRKLPIPPH